MVCPARSPSLPAPPPPAPSHLVREAPVAAWVLPGRLVGGRETSLKVRTSGARTPASGLHLLLRAGGSNPERAAGPGRCPQTPYRSRQESQSPPGPRLGSAEMMPVGAGGSRLRVLQLNGLCVLAGNSLGGPGNGLTSPPAPPQACPPSGIPPPHRYLRLLPFPPRARARASLAGTQVLGPTHSPFSPLPSVTSQG